jgi:hypothetical protein
MAPVSKRCRTGVTRSSVADEVERLGGRDDAREVTERDGGVDMTEDLDDLGPIDYLVVEFPGARLTGEALPLLLDLVDRGIIRILDLVFIRKDPDGSVVLLEIADLDGDGILDYQVLHGASSGLLGRDDIEQAGAVVEPGSAAGIVIYENVWAAPFVGALRRAGGELVAAGRVPIEDLAAALDATEPVGA